MATKTEDLVLYYSGASSNFEYQGLPNLSLGGYRSQVMLRNNSIDSLFEELGLYEAEKGMEVCRCIFLKNNSSTDSIRNLSLYITGKKDFETIEFGVSLPNSSGTVQLLENQSGLPYNVEFVEAYEEADAVELIEELKPGEEIALWIHRTLEPTDFIGTEWQTSFNFGWV